jgi:nucleolar protein 56
MNPRDDRRTIRKRAIDDTIKKLQEPVGADAKVVSAVSAMQEIDACLNLLAKRLRQWYELHAPEVSFLIEGHEAFAKAIRKKPKSVLLREVKAKHDTGGAIDAVDQQMMQRLASRIEELYTEKEELTRYIETVMKKHMPNLLAMTTPLVGAKLLACTGTLERLAKLPGSAIQVLGAEEALFKHLRGKATSPKHGVIHAHPLVNAAPRNRKGRVARHLANKIAIAARTDFYGGAKDIGKQLRKAVEARYGKD